MIATAPMRLIDLSTLPPKRRAPVLEAYARETACERIREVYPGMLVRYKTHRALVETAEALRRERPQAWAFVTARFVKRVMREGR